MMPAPDEDEGVRSLLGVVSAGLIVVSLFSVVMSYFDEDSVASNVLVFWGIGFLGLFGMVAAVVGRAFARWVLAGSGVVLIGGAVDFYLESLSWSAGPGRFEFVVVGLMVLFGVFALVVAFRSLLARRRDRRMAASTGRS